MILSLIAAIDRAGGIGKSGGIPWRLKADLLRFRQLTLGHHLIMGRKTFESIGKPLMGRTNLVVTRQLDYQAAGCEIVHTLEDGLALAENRGEEEVFVIGGGEIYAQVIPHAHRLYLTRVDTVMDCDVFFPPIDPEEWEERMLWEHSADEQNQFDFTSYLMERKPGSQYFQPARIS